MQFSLPIERSGLLINLAPVGIIPTKTMTPHVPISHDEIVEDVAACLELGVQIVHLHCRDMDGRPSSDPERYGRLIESVRGLPGGREVVICVTTSGRTDPAFQSRARVLDLYGDMKPDMASLTLGSLNFLNSASVSQPDTIRALAQRMLERRIKPELEIFDLGMANFAKVLAKEGLVDNQAYANILLGNISGAQADLLHVGTLLKDMPEEWTVCLAGLGRTQLTANTLGILYADGARVGLEDNLWFDSGRTALASNLMLVKRLVELSNALGRPLLTRQETRCRLGLAMPAK